MITFKNKTAGKAFAAFYTLSSLACISTLAIPLWPEILSPELQLILCGWAMFSICCSYYSLKYLHLNKAKSSSTPNSLAA